MKQAIVSFESVVNICKHHLSEHVNSSVIQVLNYEPMLNYEVEVCLLGQHHRNMVGDDITLEMLQQMCPATYYNLRIKNKIINETRRLITAGLGGHIEMLHHYEYQRSFTPYEYLIVDTGNPLIEQYFKLKKENEELRHELSVR